jgi:ribosomal-protein-alanine N-acetyltransferase
LASPAWLFGCAEINHLGASGPATRPGGGWQIVWHASTLAIMPSPLILTPRLQLWQMPAEFLDASLDRPPAELDGDFAVHPEWLGQLRFIALRRGQYEREPGYSQWGVWAIVERGARRMVGHISFHTTPNAEYLRRYVTEAVEFGYAVYPEFRTQGFATEAARALIDWAAREQRQRRFVMSISPANPHSQAIARRLGFVKIAQWEDDEDGTEEVFLLEIADGQTP